jgi:hypothetical protein
MATGLIERGPAAAAAAREPTSVEQTGLDLSLIADLALKLVFYNNQVTAQMISDELCLPFYNVVDKALIMLKKEELIEVAGSNGFGELAYQYSITPKGGLRVHSLLERTTYVGPAPVTLDQYKAVVKEQAISEVRVGPREVREAMADLVLEENVIDAMGQAVNTGRSLFLFGPPGNGKTILAEHIITLLGGAVLIPYCFTVDGQIIKVLDLHNHVPIPLNGRPDWDRLDSEEDNLSNRARSSDPT